ncbi:MAG: S41 family peptidase [Bacteroidota bacterium]
MTRLQVTLLLLALPIFLLAQSVDDPFPQKKMRKDLEVFREIRLNANSGLYKYRTEDQIDSIYQWAEARIEQSSTYLDFYNIIIRLTDFEGSLHNATSLPSKYWKTLRAEPSGYFPYPLKWIDGKWVVNFADGSIPLGAEVISINQVPIEEIMRDLGQYYTTDGINTTGKRIGIRTHFARYYRWQYGRQDKFEVAYRALDSDQIESDVIESVSSSSYYRSFNSRHSKPYDQIYYSDPAEDEKYQFEQFNTSTAILTINTFDMGNATTETHRRYCSFLDSVFSQIQTNGTENLIVDVRQNGGGTDPNDLVTYSYLTQRSFQENTEAWISFEKIPLLKHIDFWLPKFLRPIFVGGYNKSFRKDFPKAENGRRYQDVTSPDHLVRTPNEKAFTGKVYLLISPAVGSAGSLFAAMVAGNDNTITIGEETMGGYYGHNGHTPLAYKLPKSKIEMVFFIVNLEQDVPQRANQYYNRGIIPDITVSQSIEDFMQQEDTQMKYVLELIAEEDK